MRNYETATDTYVSSTGPIRPELLFLKRNTDEQSQLRLRTILSGALEDIDIAKDSKTLAIVENFGVSIPSPALARQVYDLCYQDDTSVSSLVFNEIIKDHQTRINGRNPYLSGCLGEVGLFGARDGKPGKRLFIAAQLLPPEDEEDIVAQEQRNVLQALIPPYNSRLRERYASSPVPHITIGTTRKREVASKAIEHLNELNILRNIAILLRPAELGKTKFFGLRKNSR